MKRVFLTVSYDGTDFHGWQLQPGVRTVEGELNSALLTLTGEEILVIGASRTDAGVHAKGNVSVFDTESTIPAGRFSYALNTILPEDVKVVSSKEVPEDFHPRKTNCVKTYEYRIYNDVMPDPLKRRSTWQVPYELDTAKMKEAAALLIGTHDFAGFCSVKTQAETTVRTVTQVEIEEISEEKEILIRVKGNGFLYNMVRIIAGTLADAGSDRRSLAMIKEAVEEADRTKAGPTAPPQGLCLKEIEFNEMVKDRENE